MPSITQLPAIIDALDRDAQRLCDRLFTVSTDTGELSLPSGMEDWAEEQFDTDVRSQQIVRVRNTFTNREALFNELRESRPKVREGDDAVSEVIEESRNGPFCHPRERTPMDTFGRVEGEHCVTASNVAKYDANHGLIIFDDHDPLAFTEEEVVDYIATAKQWLVQADGKHEFLLWHCLWKSAASIVHGHMQALSSDRPYADVEDVHAVIQEYRDLHGTHYLEDVYQAHDELGLATTVGDVAVYASLTPVKEKEIVLQHDRLDSSFAQALHHVVATLRDHWGVESFTVGVAVPPWSDMPVYARVIDRGSLQERTVDVGAMELFAGASVVASDPYDVVASL